MNPKTSHLSLSLKPSYVPQAISNFLSDLSQIDNESHKVSMLSDYICEHEEELKRVEALNIELPQCSLLMMDAIKTLKEELISIKDNMESGSGRQAPQPLVEYLPMKRKNDTEQLEAEREIREAYSAEVEFWKPSYAKEPKPLDDFLLKDDEHPNLKVIQVEACKDRDREGLLLPNEGESTSSSCIKTNDLILNYHPKPLTKPIWKNNRRSWTSELHARFEEALTMLGGIEVATPKQIRDLMQVEGLTVDQVKSHLQVEY